MVEDDRNNSADVFLRDRIARTTVRVSETAGWNRGNSHSYGPSISGSGRLVAFWSLSTNLAPGANSGQEQMYVKDTSTGRLDIESVSSAGTVGNRGSVHPSISNDGRFVSFTSYASNLVQNDLNGRADIFVRDRVLKTTVLVNVGIDGRGADERKLTSSSISGDGRFVTFRSFASNLVPNDMNGTSDIFVRDLKLGTTRIVSATPSGSLGDSESWHTAIAKNGAWIVFDSYATNLVPKDTNGTYDVFLAKNVAPQ